MPLSRVKITKRCPDCSGDGAFSSESTGAVCPRCLGSGQLELGRPFVMNQSHYKLFQNCQRLYGWVRLENLVPPSRRSALDIGTAFHTAMAVFHAGGLQESDVQDIPPDLPPEERETAEADRARLLQIAKLPRDEQAHALARRKLRELADPVSGFEDMSLGEAEEVIDRLVPAYLDYWKAKGELWHPLNQEIQFLVEVGEDTNIYLRGKSDNLSTAKGGLYLVDYKTAGRMDSRDLLKYELDTQLSAYLYGLTKYLTAEAVANGGEPIFVRGAIVDLAVKTKVPQFARELFTRSIEELREFEAEWVEICSRIRDQEDRVANGENWKTVFPKNTEHCFRYGTCAYRDLCLKDTEVRRKAYDRRDPDYVDDAQAELNAAWELDVAEAMGRKEGG